MNSAYKFSKYNVIVEKNSDEITLFNSYSGAIVELDVDTFNYITNNKLIDPTYLHFNALYNNGILVCSELDETNRIKSQIRFEINNVLSQSSNYVIAPTMQCNLNCFYCFEKSNELSVEPMNNETALNVVHFILKNLSSSVKHLNINWFGGEPLLCYETITLIGKEIKKNLSKQINFSSRIITNGILFTKKICEELIDCCNLKSAQITLDGTEINHCKAKNATSNDYTSVINNILNCAGLLDILICLNATRDNINDLYILSKLLLHDKNLKGKIRIRLVRVKPYNNENFSKFCFSESEFVEIQNKFMKYIRNLDSTQQNYLEDFPRVKPCSIIRYNDGAVDPQGYLYKCEHYLGQPQKSLGDVQNGWYYNNNYIKNSLGIEDSRCDNCCFYPRCGFSICTELHNFTGNNTVCYYYNVMQMRTKNYVKNIKGGKLS